MTIREALREGERKLGDLRIASPDVDARILLAHALGDRLARIPTRMSEPLADATAETYDALVERRKAREPLAYIVGETEFMGLRLKCDTRALVPRPDTEAVITAALEAVGTLFGPRDTVSLLIADIGTGAGGIAVALAHFLPACRVLATDIAQECLDLARENAIANGVIDRLTFLQGSDLDPLIESGCAQGLTVLVGNPPYIPTAQVADVEPEVREREPRVAFDGGADGLDFYRRVLPQLGELPALRLAVFEFGFGQTDAVERLWADYLPDWRTEIRHDLSGIERVIIVTRPE